MTANANDSGAVSVKSLGAFYYSSLQTLLVHWQVDPSVADALLPKGLQPAILDGHALVNLNWERYATVGGSFDGIVNEVEVNVVAYPTRLASETYALSTPAFFAGDDQAKVYGNYRVIVPCDSDAAIKGGQSYGENKFKASFHNRDTGATYEVPGVNSPTVTSWTVPCWTPDDEFLFQLSIPEMPGAPTPTPASPIPDWAVLQGDDGKTRIVQSGRNIFGVFDTWLQADGTVLKPYDPGVATVTVGTGDNPVVHALSSIFDGSERLVAISLFDSPPVAASTHTLLNDPIE